MKLLNRRTGRRATDPRLDMTPMIDVVFQLLIFFLVTLKQEDLYAMLAAARPQAGGGPAVELVEIAIRGTADGREALTLLGRSVTLEELDAHLRALGRISTRVPVVIRCEGGSRHGSLMQVLDACRANRFERLSVFSQ